MKKAVKISITHSLLNNLHTCHKKRIWGTRGLIEGKLTCFGRAGKASLRRCSQVKSQRLSRSSKQREEHVREALSQEGEWL